MKSNIKITVTVLVMVISLLFGGDTFAASKKLPIYSIGAAVARNASLVRNIYGDVYSPSMLYSNGLKNWFNVPYTNGVPTKESMAAIIRAQPMSFRIANPSNDYVSSFVSYNSAEGDTLFEGGNGFRLVQQVDGKWSMPTNAANVSSWLGQYCLIKEKLAYAASIELRNNDGYVMSYVNVQVDYDYVTSIGKIKFPTRYLKQKGELMVYYYTEDSQGNIIGNHNEAFDLEDSGELMVPASGSFAIETDFQQWVTLKAPDIALEGVDSYNHQGTSPLCQFTVTNAMLVHFSANTKEGEHASGMVLKQLVDGRETEWDTAVGIPTSYPFTFYKFLQPGEYLVDYKWTFLSPYPIYPDYGGGYGKDVAPVVEQ